MKYIETKIKYFLTAILTVLVAGSLFPGIALASDTEILYLTDSAVAGDSKTYLYQVDLNDVDDRADLLLLNEFPYEQVDAMAASADGTKIYLIDKVTSKIGIYDVASSTFSDTGVVVKDGGVTGIKGIVLAAFSPQGDLFIASDDTDKIYIVDIPTGVATSKGEVSVGGSKLNISGADLAFLTDGTMYVWVNSGSLTGLFEVADPYTTPLTGVQIGSGQGTYFTGLAVRENGTGDLVGSETNNYDAIIVVSKVDASFVKTYPMYKDGSLYAYSWGDMTAGPIIKPLEVEKTVETSYTRTWNWSIDKMLTNPDDDSLNLMIGQTYNVGYQVVVEPSMMDSGWMAEGVITITNPNVLDANIQSVTDTVGATLGAVSCPVSFPYTLGAGDGLECTYTIDLPSGDEATNTATVETEGLVPGDTGTALVTFGDPTTETDECVEVTDDNVGVLGSVCAGDVEKTFSYGLTFSDFVDSDVVLVCGTNTHMNTAEFTTNDTETTGQDMVTVSANLTCEYGCTLTQGYWKTHSEYGPAAHTDDTWALVGGPDSLFFMSGQTYLEVLNTPPSGGNAYYQLAHQYIAAELNMLSGASVPADVQDAFDSATVWFGTYSPDQLEMPKGKVSKEEKQAVQDLRKDATLLAGILGSYNEGLVGPGHCDEQSAIFVQALDVSSKGEVSQSQALTNGTMYRVDVSGTYRFANMSGEYGVADAEWAYRNDAYADDPLASHGWTEGEQTYTGSGGIGLDLQIDGQNIVWGDFNPLHEYSTVIMGDGSSLEFKIHDSSYLDNSGSLQVEIYEL